MRLVRAWLLAAIALAAAPAAAGASVHMTTSPRLRPGFSTGISDYVVRCVPGQPLHFAVSATSDDRVAVGGNPARTGNFTVDVTRQTDDVVGLRVTSGGKTTSHHVRCLPQDFPDWVVHRKRTPQSQWYVITPIGSNANGYMAIFDAHGTPVWWIYSSYYGPWDGKLLPNGNLAWSRQYLNLFGVRAEEAAEEHGLDGHTIRILRTQGSPTDMHDVQLLPNGNYLLDSYRAREQRVDLTKYGGPPDAKVYDGVIQELDPTGKVVWQWSSKTRILVSENQWWGDINSTQNRRPPDKREYDLVHINSMEPDGDGIVVSARFLNAIFRIDRKSKKITWKLGGTKRPWSLKIKGDTLRQPLGGNHDARRYGKDDVTVYDNGASAKRGPRVLRYRIDTAKRTATVLEDLREGRIPRSGWGGSTRKLPGGNWVTYWGGSDLMTEYTPSGKLVLDLEFQNHFFSYRAFPIPHGQLSATALRRGMNGVAHAGGTVAPEG